MITITGSMAYDYLMKFDGHFSDNFNINNKNISVSFFAHSLEKNFGGTAGNIAYSLALLGSSPKLISTLGKDYSDYFEHFAKIGISTKDIFIVEDDISASAYILTDNKNDQITSFYGGAMLKAKEADIKMTHPDIAIIAATQLEKMLQHCDECIENKIPYILDLGQSLPLWNKDNLIKYIRKAYILIVNDYEISLVEKRTSLELSNILQICPNVIITLGGEGSKIYSNGNEIPISCVKNNKIVDPTGCGDAYRAGLLYGLENKFTLEKACKLGSLVASYVISEKGTQTHSFTLSEIKDKFQDNFGEAL